MATHVTARTKGRLGVNEVSGKGGHKRVLSVCRPEATLAFFKRSVDMLLLQVVQVAPPLVAKVRPTLSYMQMHVHVFSLHVACPSRQTTKNQAHFLARPSVRLSVWRECELSLVLGV